ncbi:rhodanese-like domain-containing protein [Candidatus Saccharibacteria bacterium]|nr:rhodanese-like domain-containing protein [Candidatus Saccharibacteria bacterium]
MKYVGMVVIIILTAGVWFVLTGRNHATTTKPTVAQTTSQNYASIAKQAQTGTAMIYDVRTQDEYAAGHFAEATNFPVQDMSAGELPAFSKDTPIYVYCRSGNRSRTAADVLKKAGFTHVTDLGGLETVKRLGGVLSTAGDTL